MKYIVTLLLILCFGICNAQTQHEKIVITDSVKYIVQYNYDNLNQNPDGSYPAVITVYKYVGDGKVKVGQSIRGVYADNDFYVYRPIECVKRAVYGEMKNKKIQNVGQ